MTFREMNLRVFRGEPLPHVFFQPRIEPWYAWHKQFGKLPPRYREMSLLELFDDLKVSMRYVHYYTGMPDPVVRQFSPQVKMRHHWGEEEGYVAYETPYGDLVERYMRTVDGPWRTVQFAVKTVDDLRALRWLYQHTTYTFSRENFQQGSDFMGDRGEPQFWVPKSPYQALAQIWMKLEDLIYALADAPREVEETMRAIDDSYDALYEQIIASGMVRIVNFGENIHDSLLSPRYFECYLVPFWEKRAGQLRKAGIFTHVHIDGYFRSLLPYLKDLPFDGLEALTPLPQGDVTPEEIKEHIGDKVLLDGIPAILFLPPFTREQVMEMVEKLVKLFHPRLVLGISDELPEGGGEEPIERVRMIAEWCLHH
ncbi:MAG: hypothetical protein KatS3mg023_0961 [Armatimonadota bacterium]|nr:MAG: hypothetical protein KatS3mg023_0961 [Armatimonadota bacterium]